VYTGEVFNERAQCTRMKLSLNEPKNGLVGIIDTKNTWMGVLESQTAQLGLIGCQGLCGIMTSRFGRMPGAVPPSSFCLCNGATANIARDWELENLMRMLGK